MSETDQPRNERKRDGKNRLSSTSVKCLSHYKSFDSSWRMWICSDLTFVWRDKIWGLRTACLKLSHMYLNCYQSFLCITKEYHVSDSILLSCTLQKSGKAIQARNFVPIPFIFSLIILPLCFPRITDREGGRMLSREIRNPVPYHFSGFHFHIFHPS